MMPASAISFIEVAVLRADRGMPGITTITVSGSGDMMMRHEIALELADHDH